MLANQFMDLLYRIMPAQYWYYFVTGLAVIAAAGAVWAWLKKKDGGGEQ
jgi:Mg2+ and Co2+ transporter CorA